eukprot:g219.t1
MISEHPGQEATAVGLVPSDVRPRLLARAETRGLRQLDPASWLEYTDVKHRYGKSLMLYYRYWNMYEKDSEDDQDFFLWLDHGFGKHRDLPWLRRKKLEASQVQYMTESQRALFEIKVENGIMTLNNSPSGERLNTSRWGCVGAWQAGMNFGRGIWIFVLSMDFRLYVAQKITGRLHHSSFLAGGPTRAAGNIIVRDGKLLAIAGTSGHYRPTAENITLMKEWLANNGVVMKDIHWFGHSMGPLQFFKACYS